MPLSSQLKKKKNSCLSGLVEVAMRYVALSPHSSPQTAGNHPELPTLAPALFPLAEL